MVLGSFMLICDEFLLFMLKWFTNFSVRTAESGVTFLRLEKLL